MKLCRLIYIFILLSACEVRGQDTTISVLHLTEIPEQGLVLDKGWKFKAGDNSEWSKKEYDDKGWASISPTLELHHLPLLKKVGIGWFRLTLQVDSALQGERLTMAVSNMGASEIYLNGQLIYRFGVVSRNYNEEQTLFFQNRLLSLKLGKGSFQTLVIRYSFNKRNLYLKFTTPKPLVRVILKETNKAYADRIKEGDLNTTLRSVQSSFYLTLVFLLLFLFFSFRLQKEYLYLGIYFLCLVLGSVLRSFAFSGTNTASWSNSLLLIYQALIVLGGLAFINFAYILYKQKKSWFYYVIILYSLLIIPLYFVSYDYSGFFTAFFFPVLSIEFFRLNLQAIRRRRPGAGILLVTNLLFFIVLFWYIWAGFTGRTSLGAFLQGIGVIIPGIGLSLFIAGEFARTGAALQLRINEVEDLSQKMITKEKEKQQIMSAQNVTLEKEVARQTIELRTSLEDLKSTQTQLIQSEKEKMRTYHEKELLKLEAKALRAQMNPHFIFNCMNSIKALIHEREEDKAIIYLTTFSKLIRIIFQNSDKRETSLFDEIEICMLYTQLESMRFGDKFSYSFCVDETIDLKSVMVPALIIQPFIENAIWHGIMPKENGGVLNVKLTRENEVVRCNIDDNGIGREISIRQKLKRSLTTHQSKGMHLTQTRLDLDNLLNDRNASINIIDKKNNEGNAEGTTVVLEFQMY